MKKIFLLLFVLLLCTNVYADKMTKNGFLSKNVSYSKDQNISNPENKISQIYLDLANKIKLNYFKN